MTDRWKHRPEGSTWGDFGADDERGRLNLLTPERVRAAAAEIRDGRSFCLSLPLDYPGGNLLNERRHPPRLFSTRRGDTPNYNFPLSGLEAGWTDVISDDAVLLHTQYSTQWDALSHVGAQFDADGDGVAETVYYNGWRGGGACGGTRRVGSWRWLQPLRGRPCPPPGHREDGGDRGAGARRAGRPACPFRRGPGAGRP